MKNFLVFFAFITLLLLLPSSVLANGKSITCSNRYATLVNPVRGRNLWSDKTITPLITQYEASAKYGLPVTWLLQYDALTDMELTETIKNFQNKGENGIFLEISRSLADEAGIEYREDVRWSHPGAVFLSGYTQSERRRLIDTSYNKFKSVFGYYPKSVGAWWIDSYSLTYIKEKYGLSSIMIVADQKTTDSYGVWGQWWGYPYDPSVSNVLIPAKDRGLGAVLIQWAQRDPELGYGDDPQHSNFSLQANDYIRSGKNTDYFKTLVSTYLDCANPLGQITIGMETGMEAANFEDEYENQLAYLNSQSGIIFATMSDFSKKYFSVYAKSPESVSVGEWKMDINGRANPKLGDYIYYSHGTSFKDYFVPDKSDFLNRILDNNLKEKGVSNIVLFAMILITFIYSLKTGKINIWLAHIMFITASFGLIFMSAELFGWRVYYGLILKNLYLDQVLIYLLTFALAVFLINRFRLRIKNISLFLILLPLSFGLDGILSLLYASKLSGQYLLGIFIGWDKMIGVSFGGSGIRFISLNVLPKTLKYFYRFPFDNIFSSAYLYLLVYPLIHVVFSVTIYFILIRRGRIVRITALILLAVFYLVFLNIIHTIDPLAVLPLTN